MKAAPRHRWVLATSNPGKLAELTALLNDAGPRIDLIAQSEFGLHGPTETGETFVENALIKARHASRATGLPAIADDSGLTVAALGGAPGVRSARYAGSHADDLANRTKLLEALATTPAGGRRATFHCVVVALFGPQDPAPLVATGAWQGEITFMPAGTAGFGYDSIFFDRQLGKTAAELEPAQKNAASHRGKAMRSLVNSWPAHLMGASL